MALPKSPPRLAKTMYYERAYRRLTFPERPAQSRECECDYESDILFFRLLTPLCRVIFGSVGKVETRKKADTKKLVSVRLRPYRRCQFPFRIILHPFRSTDSSGKQGGQSGKSCRTRFGSPERVAVHRLAVRAEATARSQELLAEVIPALKKEEGG